MDLNFDLDEVIKEVHNHGKVAAAAAGLHVAQQHAANHHHEGGMSRFKNDGY